MGSGMSIDSAEKVFSESWRENLSLTNALQSTFWAWLMVFDPPDFHKKGVFQQNQY